ncbi:exonuclease V a 5' deoxyribonuclease-domain-containing protein [Kalaharituber pfeilii]|nr:exonuclease V a 5' deoxyribonuclease-domain-containing protein [Kalaharituber pfeilii]
MAASKQKMMSLRNPGLIRWRPRILRPQPTMMTHWRSSMRNLTSQTRRVFDATPANSTNEAPSPSSPPSTPSPPPPPALPDATGLSPYDRFRAKKKGLSVTDLVGTVWCEKQFEFYLVRGKKPTTKAMKKGTKIHKKLERELHETIKVDSETPQEWWGFKLLNVINRLTALRDTGRARELPVFAFTKGLFVQGVIDEISYEKPVEKDTTIEKPKTSTSRLFLNVNAEEEVPETPKKRGRKKKVPIALVPDDVDADQSSITDHFAQTAAREPSRGPRIAYISDCKTRVTASLPTTSQARATELQLMLYHYLLTTMASSVKAATRAYPSPLGPVDNPPNPSVTISNQLPLDNQFSQLFQIRDLDPYAYFSDRFIQQALQFLDESDSEADASSHPFKHPDIIRFPTFSDLLANPTLSGLLSILDITFSMAMPALSNTLSVSYRMQKDQNILATKIVEYNEQHLEEHLIDVLKWWQGQREAVGVPIEEAWKCRSCEFADECEWRMKKVDELKARKESLKAEEKGKGKKKAR